MERKLSWSQTLRYLADQFVARLADEVLTSPRVDLSTSLVRQWLTNDRHATLFLGDEQHYLRAEVKDETTVGLTGEPEDARGWFRRVERDWRIDPDAWADAIRQLNVAQSAVVETRDGGYVRLRVDARNRTHGVEPLTRSLQHPPQPDRDLPKFARDALEDLFGSGLDPARLDELVAVVVRQWQAHDGHALVVGPSAKAQFNLVLRPDGGTDLGVRRLRTNLPAKLLRCGILPDELTHYLHAINLGQPVEVTLEDGRLARVVLEPETANVGMDLVARPPEASHRLRFDDLGG